MASFSSTTSSYEYQRSCGSVATASPSLSSEPSQATSRRPSTEGSPNTWVIGTYKARYCHSRTSSSSQSSPNSSSSSSRSSASSSPTTSEASLALAPEHPCCLIMRKTNEELEQRSPPLVGIIPESTASSAEANRSEQTSPTSSQEARTPAGFEFLDFGDDSSKLPGVRRCFDWEIHGPDSPRQLDLTRAGKQFFKRRLGPTEVSYYLGSRGEGVEDGVNDMYLHLGFRAKSHLMKCERLLSIWTEILIRHQLLDSSVEYKDVNEVRFVYAPPKSIVEARARAKSLMEVRTSQDPKKLLDEYLNGARTLSDDRLAYLIFSTPELTLDAEEEQEYDFYLFSTHFLGDGMALHTTANEIFALLAGEPSDESTVSNNIEKVLQDQIASPILPQEAVEDDDEDAMGPAYSVDKLAQAMEAKLVTPEGWGRMAWTAARVEFQQNQAKLIGGQTFARASRGTRNTLVPTIAYDSAKTKTILGKCKEKGTTIAHAVFALTNFAYIRSTPNRDERLPLMIYSALNIRNKLKGDGDWYHIAIGYYNIILPSFLSSTISQERVFWHRASIVRAQTSAVVKSKWLAARSKLMALDRERRSVGFEREDEARRQAKKCSGATSSALSGLGISLDGSASPPKMIVLTAQPTESRKPAAPAVPNAALMGLSMLGNLDAMYQHKDYVGIQLHTLTTGSRQRPGAILLFAYTFAGKLWLSLGYDANGFKENVIESWWTEMQKGVDEFLLSA